MIMYHNKIQCTTFQNEIEIILTLFLYYPTVIQKSQIKISICI